ncbi:hypothetical protein A8C32_00885 [Flavivirga aquatica]|uniref:O-antigen ligase-related domain-containing protein n=1 Tax=Flavivirga aquatica TaxID=1849968 RepID=A0A1E5TBU4_9FLAO|nr:O-antigen ligase family protein [Flavivirga aquatica]OEK08863.1 hypothetical protein A8C32_00885 [Flavivirga aquatica]
MQQKKYLKLLGLHVLLGVVLYFFNVFGNIYFYCLTIYFFIQIINAKKSKKSFEILKACAYVLGVEVLLRMTGGVLFYEANKYLVIVFVLMGLFSNGFNKKAALYLLYIFLLIPSVYVSLSMLDVDTNIRKAIAFNLSGPVCLGVSALFCFGVKVTKNQFETIINYCLFPLISTLVYVILYNPNVSQIATGTASNFSASGGFGPNQVSTVLGLGIFLTTARFFYFSQTKFLRYLDLLFILLFSFRAIVTFSRGGVFTAIIMIIAFIFTYYKSISKKNKNKMLVSIVLFLIVGFITWGISIAQTNGFIEKRYTNKNAAGKEKKDITTGRGDLFFLEFEEFLNNPFFGVGVGRVKNIRFQKTGIHAASHNEMSRIIAEHGLLGILSFLILVLTPLFFRLGCRKNVLFYSFYLFWLITINHSAMRIAAPAFVYALSLLNVSHEKSPLHRKSVIS